MDPLTSRFRGKSLPKLGLRLIGRKPESKAGSSKSNPKNDEIYDIPPELPEFMTKSIDPDWIDIEMMGYWLPKCDDDHGGKCRRPFGMDPSNLGRPRLLIDVRRHCLVETRKSDRYACLSYVWGGAKTLKTAQRTLQELLEEGSLQKRRDQIPKTIRNTISLVD